MAGPVRAFLSYAHEDHAWRDALLGQLGWLTHSGQFDLFCDPQITPGQAWNGRIRDELASAEIVLFLVSGHFPRSAFCINGELLPAQERHGRDQCAVVQILCEQIDLASAPRAATPASGSISGWRWIRVGDARLTLGSLTLAEFAYRHGQGTLFLFYVSCDPGTAQWQRYLSVSWNKLGDVRVAQGDLAGALQTFARPRRSATGWWRATRATQRGSVTRSCSHWKLDDLLDRMPARAAEVTLPLGAGARHRPQPRRHRPPRPRRQPDWSQPSSSASPPPPPAPTRHPDRTALSAPLLPSGQIHLARLPPRPTVSPSNPTSTAPTDPNSRRPILPPSLRSGFRLAAAPPPALRHSASGSRTNRQRRRGSYS